jgi:hypothetical protein
VIRVLISLYMRTYYFFEEGLNVGTLGNADKATVSRNYDGGT